MSKPVADGQPKNRSRRRFLVAAGVVGGGLVVGIPLLKGPRAPLPMAAGAALSPDAYLQLTADNQLHFYVPRTEMGQGINHGLATLVAEELNIEPAEIVIHHAGAHPAYRNPMMNMQVTGGSSSVSTSFLPVRQAAANMRAAIQAAAAQELGVAPASLRLEDGWVHGGRQPRSYGSFAERAASLPMPEGTALKPRDQFRFIGHDMPRIDALAKSTGTAVFGIDIDFEGLKRAVVRRCPVIGGSVASFNGARALEMPGVIAVFAISNGVAVVAESYWQARQAAEQLETEWDLPPLAQHSTASINAALQAALDGDDAEEALDEGDVETALQAASTRVSADYSAPYLAHATMEPMNCTVRISGASCEIWAPTQAPEVVQGVAAFHTGIEREAITVHTTLMGGGFGRRAYGDFVVEAVEIAQHTGLPIQVVWSREDDTRNGYYRPASTARLSAALGADGRMTALQARRAGPNVIDYMIRDFAPVMFPDLAPDGLVEWAGGKAHGLFARWTVDPTSVEGLVDDYDVANRRITHVTVDPGLRTGFWRSVGHSFNGFAKESFIDEAALAAGADPLAFRLAHLPAGSRMQAVLEELARLGNWGAPAAGRYQGIAAHTSFGTAVAQIAEVSVDEGRIRVHKVSCVLDCGLVVNPQVVRSQMESSIVYGLTAALYNRVDLHNGAVQQGNFNDYPALRIDESPEVQVRFIASDNAPSGVGEPGLPPIAAAVANAVFAATGQRLRNLPLQLA
jgi:CO/xanthine dehydrogenase Mo-binding subunit